MKNVQYRIDYDAVQCYIYREYNSSIQRVKKNENISNWVRYNEQKTDKQISTLKRSRKINWHGTFNNYECEQMVSIYNWLVITEMKTSK